MTSKIEDVSTYSSTRFNWTIENFSNLNAHEGHRSDVFSVGSFKWRVNIYPKGVGKLYNHLSLGLVPVDWTKPVQAEFSLAVISQTDPSNTKKRELEYNFTSNDGRGISNFMRLSQLHDPAKGYLVNDTCVIRVEVTCKMAANDEGGVSIQPTISQQRPGKTFFMVCTRGIQTRFQNLSRAKSRKKGNN